MQNSIKVEIVGRDKFWTNAVLTEWRHQFPDRELSTDAEASTSSKKIGLVILSASPDSALLK